MSQSTIQEEGFIYMAMMDLKKDIVHLQNSNKIILQELASLKKSNKKTSSESTQKFQEIVKITTISHLEISLQNDLLKKQNQIHEQLTRANYQLIKATQIQNTKLNQIFIEQKDCVQKVLKANQVIVNEELTKICKQQQNKIGYLIQKLQKQNLFIQQQKLKIQQAFGLVQNFKKRNKTLQQKLLQQKIQINQFILQISKKNEILVVQKILKFSQEADFKFQNHFNQIQQIQYTFNQKKNQCLNNINQQIRNNCQTLQNYVNKIDKIKNQTESYKNKSNSIYLEQKDLFNSCKAELQNLKNTKNIVEERCNNLQRKINNFQKVIRQNNDRFINYQNRLADVNKKEKAIQEKLNGNQKKLKQAEHKIQGTIDSVKKVELSIDEVKKSKTMIDQLKNDSNSTNIKFDNLQKFTSLLQNKIKDLQGQIKSHHSHSKGHH